MTAQIANGGFEINPRLIFDKTNTSLKDFINFKNLNTDPSITTDNLVEEYNLKPLFRNQENINFIKDSMFAATNEAGGTSYSSRLKDKKFMFAGKTGSSQVKRFTEAQREADVKQEELAYDDRDHALFVAFAPVDKPKYAISVLVEHGGSGSKSAAPIAKKVIKRVLERDELRNSRYNNFGEEI